MQLPIDSLHHVIANYSTPQHTLPVQQYSVLTTAHLEYPALQGSLTIPPHHPLTLSPLSQLIRICIERALGPWYQAADYLITS